jgi:DNA invertase Pin-like site-specific DNA recombinase
MRKIIGYCRVSTNKQDLNNQELEIRRYAEKNNIIITNFVNIVISSKKSEEDRKINKLISELNEKDTLIVTELSRLGRSTLQVLNLINLLVEKGITIILIKENMKFTKYTIDIKDKIMLQMMSMMIELEREMISIRTKEKLFNLKKQGVKLGRKKGSTTTKSKLDDYKDEIKKMMEYEVSKSKIAKRFNVHRMTLDRFIKINDLN